MKESKYSPYGSCAFRETFTDEHTAKGVSSNVAFNNGIASFNGSSSKIVSANCSFDSNNNSYRIKFKATSNNGLRRYLIAENVSNSYRISAEIRASGTFYVQCGNDAVGSDAWEVFTPIIGTWYEVIIVTTSTQFVAYVNGVPSGSHNLVNPRTYRGIVNSVNIGTYRSANDRFFLGDIELIEVYNRVLTPAEALDLYNKYPYALTPPNTIALLGDKTGGSNISNSTVVNTAISQTFPDYVIGTGDYEDETVTISQLNVGLTSLYGKVFASPGNHDSAVVASNGAGPRSAFNAFYGNGISGIPSYQKVSTKYADFFLYDQFINSAETGYVNESVSQAYSIETFKNSPQGIWLANSIAASKKRFKILVMHSGPWGSGSQWGYTPGLRWDWKAYGIDLILCGHTHYYERLSVNTGSGSVPIINIGTSGAYSSDRTSTDVNSIVYLNGNTDSSFSGGMLPILFIKPTRITFELYGISSVGVKSALKDSLVINK